MSEVLDQTAHVVIGWGGTCTIGAAFVQILPVVIALPTTWTTVTFFEMLREHDQHDDEPFPKSVFGGKGRRRDLLFWQLGNLLGLATLVLALKLTGRPVVWGL